jgi:DNA mismatch repair protein MutH
MQYNSADIKSIISYAKKLEGKTLRNLCGDVLENSYSGKGKFGQLLEKFYFNYEPNSVADADFPEVGVELKSTPLKKIKGDKLVAKERLVLSIINYFEIVSQDFDTSSFIKKNSHLLLIFYLFEKDINALDYLIKMVGDWKIPPQDLIIIKQDWERIKSQVAKGKAHELSEGDTFYLGACTKGGKGGNYRGQPESEILAKQRAFSLKQGYLNHIIAVINNSNDDYGRLFTNTNILKEQSIESVVSDRFIPYLNMSVFQILQKVENKLNPNAKNFYASLTKLILGVQDEKEIEEFTKANIAIKTVRLGDGDIPKENISFPAFKYDELLDEDWDESTIKEQFEQKFFFVFLKYNHQNELVLKRVKFWNMPYNDLESVKMVWSKTKELVEQGNIVKEVKGKKRLTYFPSTKFNGVAHIRPHAQNSKDTYPLPTADKLTGSQEYTKHSFWLNNKYVRNAIYLSPE